MRGNETDESGRLKMGRAGWFDEVMRFYDRFLKGTTPTVDDPPIAVQTNDGKWRAEQQWPPADAQRYTTPLRSGSYTDDGTANATGDGAETGVWTISKPLAARRPPRGLRQRDGRRHDVAAQRQPRARRLRPRRERHRAR